MHLERYGFHTSIGEWQAHIPLVQITSGDCPPLEMDVKLEAPFEVRDMSVMCMGFSKSGRARFRIRKKYNFQEPRECTEKAASADLITDAIAEALDARLAALPVMQPKIAQRKRKQALDDDEIDEETEENEESGLRESETVD